MIIGNNDIIQPLKLRWWDVSPFINVFGCSVTNSFDATKEEYAAERDELLKLRTDRHLIYFSSLDIYNPGKLSEFANHKLRMEEHVRTLFKSYTIVRVGDITWGADVHNPINKLRAAAGSFDTPSEHVMYHVLNKTEFEYWMNECLKIGEKDTICITGKRYNQVELLQKLKAKDQL